MTTKRKSYSTEEFKKEVEEEFLPLLQQTVRANLQVKSVTEDMYTIQFVEYFQGGFPQQKVYTVYRSVVDSLVYYIEGVMPQGKEKSLN